MVDEDSHLLRADLGRPSNGGWCYQLEAALRYDITPGWSAGAGVRYWCAEVDGTSEFVHFDVKVPMDHYTSERFGVFGDVSYRF